MYGQISQENISTGNKGRPKSITNFVRIYDAIVRNRARLPRPRRRNEGSDRGVATALQRRPGFAQ
ncbi:MAG TPA: hypothetical protein VN153_02055, partial [Tahibacter sp.]|nr:hypothetical protein [Tahibacter sp.]